MGYGEDSFFTLGIGGRIGVVAISLILFGICGWVVWFTCAGLARVWRVFVAVAALWAFVWLSPQVYYLFYMVIFDGLPLQWVARVPGVDAMARLLTFSDRATLSDHGKGVLGWVLIALALLRRRAKVD